MLAPIGAALPRCHRGGLGPWGQPTIRRIDYQGGPFVGGQFNAALVPEFVIRQHTAFCSPLVSTRALLGVEEIPILPDPLRRLELRGFL